MDRCNRVHCCAALTRVTHSFKLFCLLPLSLSLSIHRYRTQLVDFEVPPRGQPKPKGPRVCSDALIRWIVEYVVPCSLKADYRILIQTHSYFIPDCFQSGGRDRPSLTMTARCPLYLQLQGHSRLVIGVVVPISGSILPRDVSLVVLDPAYSVAKITAATRERPWSLAWRTAITVSAASLTAPAYQIVFAEGPTSQLHQTAAEIACAEPSQFVSLK